MPTSLPIPPRRVRVTIVEAIEMLLCIHLMRAAGALLDYARALDTWAGRRAGQLLARIEARR